MQTLSMTSEYILDLVLLLIGGLLILKLLFHFYDMMKKEE